MKRRLLLVLTEIWLPALLVALWYAASAGSTSAYFPPLGTMVSSLRKDWLFAHVSTDLVPSLEILAYGYAAALVLGIGLGVALGLLRGAERATRPLLEVLRAIPGVALLPVFVVALGIGTSMKVTMVAVGAVWPVLLNTIDGVRGIEPLLFDVARTFRLSRADRLRRIVLPGTGPQIFAGARTALAIAVFVMVVSETVGSSGGIGYFLQNAQRNFQIADMWGTIIALGILGYLLNMTFRLVESIVLRWHRLQQARHDQPAPAGRK
ncbi:ABC transporter permease [Streptomyces sp. NPDC051320]|uniref:ABC transporter permease n=1 Tax=Streptomyces sp. NPDC051320 TaxID=3154644 RepID=UPI003426469B